MAKKTRKQKIISEIRRKILSVQINSPTASNKTELPEKEKAGATPPPSQNTSFYIYPIQLIKKDLTKTLLLSILAISLEIALFFVLERHLGLPFKIKF